MNACSDSSQGLERFLDFNFKKAVLEGNLWYQGIIDGAREAGLTLPPGFSRRFSQLFCEQQFYGIAPSSIASSVFKFLLSWGFVNFILIRSCFETKKIDDGFVIWDSDFERYFSREKIKQFFQGKKIVNIQKDLTVFCRSTYKKNSPDHVIFKKRPMLESIQHLRFSIRDAFWLNYQILKSLGRLIKLTQDRPLFASAWKDFLTEPLISFYLKKGLRDLYRTNSDFNSQEYWAENAPFNTVWYSSNTRSLQYRGLPDSYEIPMYYFAHFGKNWVWSRKQAEWLANNFNATNCDVVGPIIFYQPENKTESRPSSPNSLLVFDVTPFENDVVKERIFRRGFNYYHESVCLQFITDIVEVADSKKHRVYLKPKRSYQAEHSKKYVEAIRQMQESGKIEVLSPETNIFDEMGRASAVISIPMTSPFEVARLLGRRAVYYDPTGLVDFERMGISRGDFAGTVKQLADFIESLKKPMGPNTI